MEIKNKDKIHDLKEEEEAAILPEGYDGGDLFDENGKQGADDAEKHPEKGEETGEAVEPATENAAQVSAAEPQKHDFRQEIAELLEQYPDLRQKLAKGEGLPGEVISDCVKNGTVLRAAYAEYEAKQARAEAEQMRREIEILKQNSAAAAKAPVKGTAAGCGVKTEGKDPFLEGLLSEE